MVETIKNTDATNSLQVRQIVEAVLAPGEETTKIDNANIEVEVVVP